MTLADAASIAQIALAIITAIGLVVTLGIAISTISEVKKDRALRHRPYLAFEQGASVCLVDFVAAGKSIPGVNPAYVAKVLPHLPPDALSVRIRGDTEKQFGVGKLTNFGVGPALHTNVTWIPRHLRIGTDSFQIDAKKLEEPIYCRKLNSMPSFKAHISPNSTTCLSRLPTFIEKDIEHKITEVTGILEITCLDIFHKPISTRQEFRIFPEYTANPPHVCVTFGNLLPTEEEEAARKAEKEMGIGAP